MQSIKNILKSSLYLLVFIIAFTFLISIINYFNLFNYKITNIIKIIIPILSFLLAGYKIGKKSMKNGWLEGLKLSLFISLFLIIITTINHLFNNEYLIYLIILIFSCTLGSMIGINKKNTLT